MKYYLIIVFSMLIFIGCDKKEENQIPTLETMTILEQLVSNYEQLPEQQVSVSFDKSVYATYANPTEIYEHGVLGDKIEATQLVVAIDSIFYELELQSDYVFEDIRPRLYDVDGDSDLEFITIRSNISEGAGIVIYKVIDEELVEYAIISEIGTPNRWLNIVAINDLDKDGVVELVWIQTPHIGGILKVAKIEPGTLKVLTERSLYSNHAIGERNLCLSLITEVSGQKVFYVPNQSRDKVVGFTFDNNELNEFQEIIQDVDFSKTLSFQLSFSNIIEEEDNCIIVE